MCGAFTIGKSFARLAERFGVKPPDDAFCLRYNVRPLQYVPVVLDFEPQRIQMALWGLRPEWAKVRKIGPIINTRAESFVEKPGFKRYLKSGRCLVLADGFYEWAISTNGKQPYRFYLADQDAFAFAGIWDNSGEGSRPAVSIVTTKSNSLVAKVHDRMPAILERKNEKFWLNAKDEKILIEMLLPFPERIMRSDRVSRLINSVNNDSIELIRPSLE
jgi:putative SOS response-associated peptidase YedK